MRVLLIGYRQGLMDALQRQSWPFTLWPGKELMDKKRAYPIVPGAFPDTYKQLLQILPQLEKLGPFARVIAGTESSVPLAAGLQRLWGLPGPSPLQYMRCHDKFLMKQFLASHHIPMTPYIAHRPGLEPQDLLQALGAPVVCKERGESGGRAIYFCENAAELSPRMGPRKLYERFVAGPEFSIEAFRYGGKTIFRNVTQYFLKAHINIVPAIEGDEAELFAFNEKVLDLLGIQDGLTHLEVYQSRSGPIFGEIAIRPPGGYIMELISLAYGFNAWDAFVQTLRGQELQLPAKPHRYTAAHIFHPGAGEFLAVHGWDALKKDPTILRAKLKVQRGVRIAKRFGVGQDIGYILQGTEDPKALLGAIHRVRGRLQFEIGA